MLIETLRTQLTKAMKENNVLARDAIRVLISHSDLIEARTTKPATDEELHSFIRKSITDSKDNIEKLKKVGREEDAKKQEAEIAFLQSFLPTVLTQEEIEKDLESIKDAIISAKNDGQATGVAMKHFKQKDAKVLGDDVKQVVQRMRGSSKLDPEA